MMMPLPPAHSDEQNVVTSPAHGSTASLQRKTNGCQSISPHGNEQRKYGVDGKQLTHEGSRSPDLLGERWLLQPAAQDLQAIYVMSDQCVNASRNGSDDEPLKIVSDAADVDRPAQWPLPETTPGFRFCACLRRHECADTPSRHFFAPLYCSVDVWKNFLHCIKSRKRRA